MVALDQAASACSLGEHTRSLHRAQRAR